MIIYDTTIVIGSDENQYKYGKFLFIKDNIWTHKNFCPYSFSLLTLFVELEFRCVTEAHYSLALHTKTSFCPLP
jgi:hypothetical protein